MAEALPKEMNCVVLDGFGGPEVLKPGRRPVPAVGAEDVLIKVAAAGICGTDFVRSARPHQFKVHTSKAGDVLRHR